MTQHRDRRAWDDAMADQQTKPVGQSAPALHPAMALAAQPDQPGQRESGRIPSGTSPAARQPVMRIDTRSAAENAAVISVPNEITRGRSVATQRRRPVRFGADWPPATSQSGAARHRGPANQRGRTLHGSTIAPRQSHLYTGN